MDREILRIALPAIVSNITVPLLSLADIAIMGHIGDATYLAAISIGTMMFNVMYWLLGFLRMGTSGMTAQAFGAGDRVRIKGLFYGSLRSALLLGLLIIALSLPLLRILLWAFQTGEEVEGLVSAYFYICIFGAPAVLGNFALTGWLIGMQNTRITMVVSIAQNIINILLSVTFVFLVKLDVKGVAMGTMLSQWIAFLSLLFFSRHTFADHLKGMSVIFRDNGVSLWKGSGGVTYMNIFLRTVCLVAVNLYFTSAGSAQGTVVLAVNTLLMTFFTLFSYIMDGFAFAGEAIGGRMYGKGDGRGLGAVHRRLLMWGAALVVLYTALYAFLGNWLVTLLTTDSEVINRVGDYFHFVLLIPVAGAWAFIYDGLFIGMTRTREMLLSTLIGAISFFMVFLSLRAAIGNSALWLALLSYLLFRGAVLAVCFSRRPVA